MAPLTWAVLRWQGLDTPTPSDEECLQSCLSNAAEAARKEAEATSECLRLPPADERVPYLRLARSRFAAEKAGWEQSAMFYRDKSSRVPGEDDVATATDQDDEPVSAWADIGGVT